MLWPEDHPGRTCARCGREVYKFWVDPTYPPPGRCMFEMPHARLCDDFKAFCINHLSFCRITDKSPHPKFLESLDRAGITLDEAIKWREEFQAKIDAEDAKTLATYGLTN